MSNFVVLQGRGKVRAEFEFKFEFQTHLSMHEGCIQGVQVLFVMWLMPSSLMMWLVAWLVMRRRVVFRVHVVVVARV